MGFKARGSHFQEKGLRCNPAVAVSQCPGKLHHCFRKLNSVHRLLITENYIEVTTFIIFHLQNSAIMLMSVQVAPDL